MKSLVRTIVNLRRLIGLLLAFVAAGITALLLGFDLVDTTAGIVFAVSAAVIVGLVAAIRGDVGPGVAAVYSAARFLVDMRKAGVARVYFSRAHAEPDISNMLLKQAEKKEGWIILTGVSLREYFLPQHYQILGGEPFLARFAEAIKLAGSAVRCDIIISDPTCTEANRRADLEGTGLTLREITTALEQYERFFFDYRDRVRLWTGQLRPFLFAAITSHLGAFEQRYRSAPRWAPGSKYFGPGVERIGKKQGCFGDTYPVFRLNPGQEFFEMLLAELRDFIEHDCTLIQPTVIPEELARSVSAPLLTQG